MPQMRFSRSGLGSTILGTLTMRVETVARTLHQHETVEWPSDAFGGRFDNTLLDAYFALVQKIVSQSIHLVVPQSDSLLVVRLDVSEILECELTLHVLFSNVGARNFLFINVPPIDRSPLVSGCVCSTKALIEISFV